MFCHTSSGWTDVRSLCSGILITLGSEDHLLIAFVYLFVQNTVCLKEVTRAFQIK